VKKNRKIILIVIGAIVVVLIVFFALVNFITNWQWFAEVGYESVFLTRFLTQIAIGIPVLIVIGVLAFFFLKTLKKSYHKRVTPAVTAKKATKTLKLISIGLSVVIAAIAAVSIANSLWLEVLKFTNSTGFGMADPVFNQDISFYVFKLDLFKELNTTFIWLVVGFAIIAFVYYKALERFNPPDAVIDDKQTDDDDEEDEEEPRSPYGRIFENIVRMAKGEQPNQSPKRKPSTASSAGSGAASGALKGLITAAPYHAVVLGVILFLAVGVNFFFAQFDLLYSDRGALYGAGYTDVNVTLLVNRILMVLSVFGAAGVIVALKKNRFRFVIAVPVVMAAVALIGMGIGYIIQSFVVTADEINLENQYLRRNIEYTQYAYGLDNISSRDFPVTNNLTNADIEANYQTISNIRINDYDPVELFYNNIQTIRPYYVFTDVYVDRYMVNGEYTQVYIAAREVDDTSRSPIPQTFLNRYIKYTHGYGITLSRVDSISQSGLPEMLIRNIPPQSDVPEINIARPEGRPEIYFGNMTNDFILVNTTEPEFDYPIGGAEDGRNAECFYEGDAGIKLNFLNRILFAAREGNIRILVSGALTDDSKIVINRNIVERVQTIMPYLSYDPEPYMVTADGRLFWIIDAYTYSNSIPYSEPYSESMNYIRNSVKVVIDAYNGTTNYYVVDPTDPVAATYRSIFPALFKDIDMIDEMSPELRNHLRYPKALLSIQADMFRRYHMSDVTMFYQNEDLWDIATEISGVSEQQMSPNYYIMKLPGEHAAEFVNTIPFTPRGRRNMSSLLVARNDGDFYGELVLFRLPKGKQVPGPMQVDAQIEQDGQISQDIALWSQSGSLVSRGNMFIVPIENSFLYIKPIYIEAETGSIPEVRRVVVAYGVPDGDGVRIAYQPTLDAALEELFGQTTSGQTPQPPGPGRPEPGSPEPPVGVNPDIVQLIQLLAQAHEGAQNAQRNGDWAAYGEYLAQIDQYLAQLVEMTG